MYSITHLLILIRSPATILNSPINLFCPLDTALVLTLDDFPSIFPSSLPPSCLAPLWWHLSKTLTQCSLYSMFSYIYSGKTSVIVKMLHLSFCVFVCAFHLEISFFGKFSLFFLFFVLKGLHRVLSATVMSTDVLMFFFIISSFQVFLFILIVRKEEHSMEKKTALDWNPQGSKRRGRLKNTWKRAAIKETAKEGKTLSECPHKDIDKKYVKRKEIERHLPDYYSFTLVECTDDDEKR